MRDSKGYDAGRKAHRRKTYQIRIITKQRLLKFPEGKKWISVFINRL